MSEGTPDAGPNAPGEPQLAADGSWVNDGSWIDSFTDAEVDDDGISAEEAQRAQELVALRDGALVDAVAEETEAYSEAMTELVTAHPGIQTREAVEAITPIFRAIEAEFGPEAARHPEVLQRIYERAGGDERFGDALIAEDYRSAIAGHTPNDVFTGN